MERRNTIQKELVLNAVIKMHRHVTAEEVYEYIKSDYPSIGKGTVYRNLGILSDENKIRKVEISGGADCFDFTLKKHYHVRCVVCGEVSDVDMDEIKTMDSFIHDKHGMKFLDYDISFKGICNECQKKQEASKYNG